MRVNPRFFSCYLSCAPIDFRAISKSLNLLKSNFIKRDLISNSGARLTTSVIKTCLQHDRVWTTAKLKSNEKESWQELAIVDMSSISPVLSIGFYAVTGLYSCHLPCSTLILSNSVFTAACKTWVFKRYSPAIILLWLPIITNCWRKIADLTGFFYECLYLRKLVILVFLP